MPITFDHTHLSKRYVIYSCSNRVMIINAKNYRIMKTLDFADHDAAVFAANRMIGV